MKNLKTVIILIAVLLCTQLLVAQSKPTFIIKGGLSSASMNNENELFGKYSKTGDNRLGFSVGVCSEVPLIVYPFMNFEAGLLLSQKGMKGERHNVTIEYSPLYVEIPLGFKAVATVSNIGVYGNLGTYLGYGFGGKKKGSISGSIINATSSDDISWGSDDGDDLKPFDFGYNVGAGVIFGKLEAGLYTTGSFINISPTDDFDNKMKNFVFGFMVGYRI